MKTYKIGNKAKCIIRSFCPGMIGEEEMQFANQPYTILNDVRMEFRFDHQEVKQATPWNKIMYSADNLAEITISDVELTNKILNLIYRKNEIKKCHATENLDSYDNKLFFAFPSSEIQDLFIYDDEGRLEYQADNFNKTSLDVLKDQSNYLVCYSYLIDEPDSYSYQFQSNPNFYLTLDFIITGNSDDETKNSFIHINKCALSIDKDMYFNNISNAVDLKFTVIHDKEEKNYITLN